jgi:twitching motility two-component system response regulator PilG
LAEAANLRGVKVMVIDDSNTIRRSAEIFLVQGWLSGVARRGRLRCAGEKLPITSLTVIFCDIVMPRLDGYQTCALIKKSQRFRSTPVIMLSSKDGLFDRARGRMVGSDQLSDEAIHQRQSAADGRVFCTSVSLKRSGTCCKDSWGGQEDMSIRKILVVDDSPTETACD